MDLDRKDQVSLLEVAAWFKRNEFIICRPLRKRVKSVIEKRELFALKAFFNFLDADGNDEINRKDLHGLLKKLDKNGDEMVS